MSKFIQKYLRYKEGFTLVELVVVIAILGILVAIAVPKLTTSRAVAADTVHQANIKTLTSAAIMFIADKGVPTKGDSIVWSPAGGTKASSITDADSVAANAWAKYLQEWPKAPTGTSYSDVNGKGYKVIIYDTGQIDVNNDGVNDATLPEE